MAKRRKLKAAFVASRKSIVIHDRLAEAPFNANIALDRVDDAYGIAEFPDFDERRGELVSRGQPQVHVVRSLRDDPLAAMRRAGQISQVQYEAGRRWEGWHEMSQVGPIRAMDPARDKVDGGKIGEPVVGRTLYAQDMLHRCRAELGHEGDQIVNAILGWRRVSIGQLAHEKDWDTEAGRKYFGRRFRECLDSIAKVAGLMTAA